MKKHLILTCGFLMLIALGSVTISAQDDVYSNENAPANYDANLRAGAKAVGAIRGDLETVNIISKSGGVYKTTMDDGRINEYLFRSSAVYPYFEVREFEKIIYGAEDSLTPYLECYAKKRGVNFDAVKGDGFRPPYFLNANAMRTEMQNGQAKLAEIETRLKTLAARPDTFLSYRKNPAVWYDIAANRAEYLPCALGERQTLDVKDSPWLRAHRDGIAKVMQAVSEYDPATKISMGSDSEYAHYAVSQKTRADWLKEKNALAFKEEIDRLLKPLEEGLAKKLPTFFPKMEKYAVRSPAEEALMKRVLTNPARYKIFKIGLAQSAWKIDKGVLGIPDARYKNGVIYLRDTQADHPYCYATYVNVIQDYAGGGRYAASRSALVLDELVACPAGK